MSYKNEMMETMSVDSGDYDRKSHLAVQPYCMNCYVDRCNTDGCLSTSQKAWFCSGGCMTYYFYKNQLAKYSQHVEKNLIKMGSEHFPLELLNKRRKGLGLPTML
jgi:hypothetical protein